MFIITRVKIGEMTLQLLIVNKPESPITPPPPPYTQTHTF